MEAQSRNPFFNKKIKSVIELPWYPKMTYFFGGIEAVEQVVSLSQLLSC